MLQDPIIKELRQVRQKIEEECQNDVQLYYEHIRKIQLKYRNRLIRRKPKPALKLAKVSESI